MQMALFNCKYNHSIYAVYIYLQNYDIIRVQVTRVSCRDTTHSYLNHYIPCPPPLSLSLSLFFSSLLKIHLNCLNGREKLFPREESLGVIYTLT